MRRTPATWLVLGVSLVGAAAVLGVVALWPRGEAPALGARAHAYVDATVTGVDTGTCVDSGDEAPVPCTMVAARLTSGSDASRIVRFQVRSTQPDAPSLEPGDDVVLADVPANPDQFRYSFVDFQRDVPMLWLAVVFAAVLVAVGRWRGVRALLVVGASGVIVLVFLVPSLLRDQPVLPVVLAAAAAITLVGLYVAHGLKISTTIAVTGSLLGLALCAVGAYGVAFLAELTHLADQDGHVLQTTASSLDLRGLLVAGIVVGALGALSDLTVRQVSAVETVRRLNPGLSSQLIYYQAMRSGREHMAGTVTTLLFAYVGASLPLLVFFTLGTAPVGQLLTSEIIAVEIVRMLVGAIAVVAAVPITTGLATVVLGPGEDPNRQYHEALFATDDDGFTVYDVVVHEDGASIADTEHEPEPALQPAGPVAALPAGEIASDWSDAGADGTTPEERDGTATEPAGRTTLDPDGALIGVWADDTVDANGVTVVDEAPAGPEAGPVPAITGAQLAEAVEEQTGTLMAERRPAPPAPPTPTITRARIAEAVAEQTGALVPTRRPEPPERRTATITGARIAEAVEEQAGHDPVRGPDRVGSDEAATVAHRMVRAADSPQGVVVGDRAAHPVAAHAVEAAEDVDSAG